MQLQIRKGWRRGGGGANGDRIDGQVYTYTGDYRFYVIDMDRGGERLAEENLKETI